jgi:uncharacterized protein (TIGR04255 family)
VKLPVPGRLLGNKPLIEAIFEARWRLQNTGEGAQADPHYSLLVGRLYERLREDYPHHEKLPAASIPDEVIPYVVQHRFRAAEGSWPLVQLGPGVLTLNDTSGYRWMDFENRMGRVVQAFADAQPSPGFPALSRLLLRYIDAVRFDFSKRDVLEFLRDEMHVSIAMQPQLFADTGVTAHPRAIDVRFDYESSQPSGSIYLRFARGRIQGDDAIVWETAVQSEGESLPSAVCDVTAWATEAHRLANDWFFKTIEGNLRKEFA